MKYIILNILGFVALTAIVSFYYYKIELNDVFGFESIQNELNDKDTEKTISSNISRILMLFYTIIPMLVGIFFSALYNQVKDKNESISYRSEMLLTLKSSHLLKVLLLAPLLLTGIFTFSGTSPNTLTTVLFAFQNGFFCESILKERKS